MIFQSLYLRRNRIYLCSALPDGFMNRLLNADTSEYTFCSVEADFGVKFTLTPQGQLASCRDLRESELNELGTRQNILQVENGINAVYNLSEEQIYGAMFGNSSV